MSQNYIVSVIPDDKENIWIGQDYTGGIVKYDGINWTNYNTHNSGLTNNYVTCMEIDRYGNKWIGTAFPVSLNVFREEGVILSNRESMNKSAIKEFILHRNYPNPFNPVTTIKYSIPKQSYVELKIYDILGREISTLINKEQNAGEYHVQFDGSCLSSGMYIYRIKAGDYIKSQKMLLLK